MSVPGSFAANLNRVRGDLQRFRNATSTGKLDLVALGSLLDGIVRLIDELSRDGCFGSKPSGDIRIKGPNIRQN